MNTKLGSLKIPSASLLIFLVVFIMILALIYNHFFIPFAWNRLTKIETGISQLQRIGISLFLSILAVAVAALVEREWRSTRGYSIRKVHCPLQFSVLLCNICFWDRQIISPWQAYLDFSSPRYHQASGIKHEILATSICWASLAMRNYLSSLIVSIVNNVTENTRNSPWFSGHTINGYRLNQFYWLMCVLSVLNFMHYLFWAMRYKYRPVGSYK